MRKRILSAACGLLFSLMAAGQTTTYTGVIKDLSNAVVTSGQVTFTLQPSSDTTISGIARFVPFTVSCGINGSGLLKDITLANPCVVTNNTSLTPSGTSYKICIQAYSVTPGSCFNAYALGTSTDITTIVPTPGTSPAYTFVDTMSNQTIGGNKTYTGTITGSGDNTFTWSGSLNAKRIEGARQADQFGTINLACADLPGGEVYVPVGITQPVAQVTCSTPAWIHGAGINQTIIKPTSGLAATLFSLTAAAEGWRFSDMTIDMTNAGSQNIFDIAVGANRPVFENIRYIYPAGASGIAFNVTNGGEPHFRNIMGKFGNGFLYNGDNAAEAFFDGVAIESSTSYCFKVTRTTTTDIGGFYLQHFKCTNPGNQAANQAFILTSTIANSVTPFMCTDCVGDNAMGGPALSATNINLVFIGGDSWLTTSAANASGALTLNGVNDFIWTGGHIQSGAAGSDITLAGTNGSLNLANMQLRGSNKSIVAAGSTLSSFRPIGLSYATAIAGADELVLAGAAPGSILTYGGWFGTRNDLGQAQEFCLVNKTIASPTAPFKCFRVGSSGELQLLNSANAAVLLTVADNGTTTMGGTLALGTNPISGVTSLTLNNQIISSLATGTAPFSISSTTPVANLAATPTTYNAAGTQQTGTHVVEDSIALSSGTPSTATVTLSGAAAFGGTNSYKCALTNETTQANPVKYARVSSSSFTITGPNTVTDTVSFVCVGN